MPTTSVFLAKPGNISITVAGGSMIVPVGTVSLSFSDNPNTIKDNDCTDDFPTHWKGNKDKGFTLKTRDYQLYLALQTVKFITSMSAVLTAALNNADPSDERAAGANLQGTNLALVDAVEGEFDNSGKRSEYSLKFEVSHDADGAVGTLDMALGAIAP